MNLPAYPVRLEPAFSGGFFVRCDAFDGVVAYGDDTKQALQNAAENLGRLVLKCEYEKRSPPKPPIVKPGDLLVTLKFPP